MASQPSNLSLSWRDSCIFTKLLPILSRALDPKETIDVDVFLTSDGPYKSYRWNLARIQNHMSCPGSPGLILRLPTRNVTLPRTIINLNLCRNSSRALLKRHNHDSASMVRGVIVQPLAYESPRIAGADLWVHVVEGLVIVLVKTELEEQEISDMDALEKSFPAMQSFFENGSTTYRLEVDHACYIRAGSAYSLLYVTSGLLISGELLPPWETNQPSLCDICLAVPFDILPFEEDLGYPHHLSLQNLQKSSLSCLLCHLILESVNASEAALRLDTFMPPPAAVNNSGRPIRSDPRMPGKYQVTQYYQHTGKLGNVTALRSPNTHDVSENLNDMFGKERYQRPRLNKPLVLSQDPSTDQSLDRPWLYGNWWLHPAESNRNWQLIGIGARLTQQPGKIALGDSKECESTLLRGSDIRLIREQMTEENTIPFEESIMDGLASRYIPTTTVHADPFSDGGLRCLKRWIRGSEHLCPELFEDSDLPSRVLDLESVKNIEVVRLIQTQGQKGRYVALSHCWSSSTKPTTTQTTLKAHLKGIQVQGLSGVFQKAIIICVSLGIRYLWIDSFCIIQDDIQDWLQESSRMCDIYTRAWLTIAMSDSEALPHVNNSQEWLSRYVPPDCLSTGFKETRQLSIQTLFQPTSHKSDILYFSPEWMPPSIKTNPRMYVMGTFGKRIDFVADEPLSKRGWTLQERFLAPRYVQYTKSQMLFEAGNMSYTEDGAVGENLYCKDRLLAYRKPPTPLTQDLIPLEPEFHYPTADPMLRLRHVYGWPSIVGEYSRRELTVKSDKLPALSGLAKFLAGATNDVYLAGLWRRHVLEDLSWRIDPYLDPETPWSYEKYLRKVASQSTAFSNTTCVSQPSQSYRAPSWSWASIDGPVRYEQFWSNNIQTKFVDAEVGLAGGDPYGAVKSGWLTLEGPLLQLEYRPEIDAMPGKIALETMHNGKKHKGYAIFDSTTHLSCLGLFLDAECALLLRRCHDTLGVYERVGFAKFPVHEDSARRVYMRRTKVIKDFFGESISRSVVTII